MIGEGRSLDRGTFAVSSQDWPRSQTPAADRGEYEYDAFDGREKVNGIM